MHRTGPQILYRKWRKIFADVWPQIQNGNGNFSTAKHAKYAKGDGEVLAAKRHKILNMGKGFLTAKIGWITKNGHGNFDRKWCKIFADGKGGRL